MKEGRPSRTAEGMAIHRGMESMKPEGVRVCYDPFALGFLSARYRIIAKSPTLAKFAYWYLVGRKLPAAIGEGVVRTRYIDDYLRECIGGGIRQLVILGAGYDTRAYRIDGLNGKVRVFEVDHPATQRVKTERLKDLLGSLPNHVVYVPINFDGEELDQRLYESGYDKNLKTLFIWEGVTPYLTAEAVDQTLAFVANCSGEGSSIIFNYMYEFVVDGTWNTEEARRHRESVAKLGEPFVFGIREGTIDDFLSRRGFYQVSEASPEYLERTYFTGANQGRKVCPYIPTVHATVKPRG